MPPEISLARFFAALPDPRLRRARRHSLLSILFICLCATLAGADGPVAIARWAKAKRDWLAERLEFPHGLPSHDTVARVLARLDADAFHQCFVAWTKALRSHTGGEVLALDGKTIRASAQAGLPALHLVSVWAAQSRLVLAQRPVQGHENEIVAVPDLLALLDLRGCLVTGDALLCQKGVAARVVSQGGDYVLALKENHPSLHERVAEFFGYWDKHGWETEDTREAVAHQFAQTAGKGHGRVEARRCWLVEGAADWLDTDREWAGLRSVACVQAERRDTATGKVSRQTRYFLTSVSGAGAARAVLRAVRLHWGIENRLHWVLDVVFDEDRRRTRSGTGDAARNLALLSKMALNLIRQDETPDLGGVKGKRQVAGWDTRFLETLLTGKTYKPDER
jgi:predicted transposase YbfD/YdcC